MTYCQLWGLKILVLWTVIPSRPVILVDVPKHRSNVASIIKQSYTSNSLRDAWTWRRRHWGAVTIYRLNGVISQQTRIFNNTAKIISNLVTIGDKWLTMEETSYHPDITNNQGQSFEPTSAHNNLIYYVRLKKTGGTNIVPSTVANLDPSESDTQRSLDIQCTIRNMWKQFHAKVAYFNFVITLNICINVVCFPGVTTHCGCICTAR
jgi:hypothetical protein